jgi:GTP cyclohydrolase I
MNVGLPDIQDETDSRGIELDEVGIAGLRYPIVFSDGDLLVQAVAEVEVTVTLPHDRRGTHMSRMVQFVDQNFGDFDPRKANEIVQSMLSLLNVEGAGFTFSFPFGTPVVAPESQLTSLQTHDLKFQASVSAGVVTTATSVTTDVTSVCPCSKAISDYGAHNQRSRVTLTVVGSGKNPYPVDAARMVALVRTVGSAPVYPLVKRVDERSLTMTAHDNALFVEDMARKLAICEDLSGLEVFVEVRNLESIHSHDAIARLHSPGTPESA